MKKLHSAIIAVAMLFTLTACEDNPLANSQPQPNGTLSPTEPAEPTDSPITTELTVWGMVCGSCTRKIEGLLGDNPDIISVEAEFAADKVTIVHSPDLDLEEIERLIESEGFNVA
ncbi:MAG: heavy-metal-associated domain-containing protein [Oscillospiraceae bacterium]|nr:heavy-metal-associated domain-containing protein [Oscillospiraceae bacterium]